MKIIDSLGEDAIGEFELAQKTSQDIDDIQQALSFLETITEKGRIHIKEKSPQQWCLSPWS